jgi:hypothetical protein
MFGGIMAKRASAAKTEKKSDVQELNPGVSSAATWNVYSSGMPTFSINADHLDVTENGTLIFINGGSNGPPQVVVAGDQYLYCTKVR